MTRLNAPAPDRPRVRSALFLDRDGVVNVDTGYLHRIDACAFLPGIFDLVRQAHARGYAVFIVTNQAGIARGYYGEADFQLLMQWMLSRFAAEHAPITQVYHCPHHPSEGIAPYRMACACRKPAAGMLLQAASEHGIDLGSSVMVGDSLTDMQAAESAGIARRILIGDAAEDRADPAYVRVATHAEVARAIFTD